MNRAHLAATLLFNFAVTVAPIAAPASAATLNILAELSARTNTPVIIDAAGTLYGTTLKTATVAGSLFNLSSTGIFTTLFTYDSSNGGNPVGGLLMDAAGTLFGLRSRSSGNGTAFSLTKSGIYTTLASFGPDVVPTGVLIADAGGTLYGTANSTATDLGLVYSITGSGFDTGTTAAIPEPQSWAMLIAGFGLIGAAARRRRLRHA